MLSFSIKSTVVFLTIATASVATQHGFRSVTHSQPKPIVVSAEAAKTVRVRTASESPMKERARERLAAAHTKLQPQFSPDEAASASGAIRDVLRFLDTHSISREPRSSLSDDGLATLQWRSGNTGVMLVFSGDGQYTFSEKRTGTYYISDPREIALEDSRIEMIESALNRVFS